MKLHIGDGERLHFKQTREFKFARFEFVTTETMRITCTVFCNVIRAVCHKFTDVSERPAVSTLCYTEDGGSSFPQDVCTFLYFSRLCYTYTEFWSILI
jgi:hypothetical protein